MAQVSMKIIIDVNGLFDFYKDINNPNWGSYNAPCIADSFCKLMAANCAFTGPTGSIINWMPDSEYTWNVSVLDEEFSGPITVEDVVDDCKIIMELVQAVDGHRQPEQRDWEKIFVFDYESKMVVDADGRLLISEVSEDVLKIKTQSIILNDCNLNYSIKFRFNDPDGIDRYGVIDPFIKVRSGDGNGQAR